LPCLSVAETLAVNASGLQLPDVGCEKARSVI
jgi:hypothetical protein